MDRPPNTSDSHALLKVPAAAAYLNTGRSAAYNMTATGQLPTVRIGRSVRVPKAALDAWLAEQVREPTSPPVGRIRR